MNVEKVSAGLDHLISKPKQLLTKQECRQREGGTKRCPCYCGVIIYIYLLPAAAQKKNIFAIFHGLTIFRIH